MTHRKRGQHTFTWVWPNTQKKGLGTRSLTGATPLGKLRAKLQLGYGGQPCHHCFFLLLFVYNMSLYCMSCIICLNKIYFIYVQAQKPGNISRGLWSSWDSHTQRWTYHPCDKNHHGYAMVVHRDKLYCSDQRDAPGVTSWEVQRPSLWGPLT